MPTTSDQPVGTSTGRRLFFGLAAVGLWLLAFLQTDDADYRPGNPVVPWILFYALSGLCCAWTALGRVPRWLVTGLIGAGLAFLSLSLSGAWFLLTGDHDVSFSQAMEWGAMRKLADQQFVEQGREAGGVSLVLILLSLCALKRGRSRVAAEA